MKKKFLKFFSLVSIFLMILNSIPLSVYAGDTGETLNEERIDTSTQSKEIYNASESNSGDSARENTSNESISEQDDELNDCIVEDGSTDSEQSTNLDEPISKEEEDSDDCSLENELVDPEQSTDSNESESEEDSFEGEEARENDSNLAGSEKGESKEPFDIEELSDNATEKKEESNESLIQMSLSYHEAKTSKLGHIRSGNVKIYEDNTLDKYFIAGTEYTNKVYYIKKQADIGGELYYLISNSPSSVNGVVGWVRADDLSTHNHIGFDKDRKTFYFNGTGKTYTKAWGGSQDLVYDDLKPYEGDIFQVHLTEKVGNNTWYRGTFNGITMWIHSSYVKEVTNITESNTSKLGHIRSGNVKIYENLSLSKHVVAGSEYTNAVYYIKKEAKVDNESFYLISTSPSSTNGVVGWVKSNDLSYHTHNGTDKTPKEFYFTGKGKAYSKAWGGSKDLVADDLSKMKSQSFEVDLTEKVGNNTWYRGTIDGERAWVHSSYVTDKTESNTSLLGHLRAKATIYGELGKVNTILPTNQYTNAVYYIKKQAKVNNDTFYLISTSPSSTNGVVGWVKSDDLSYHTHNGTDKTPKVFYFNGKGSAFSKAWGGSKDLVYKDMGQFKDDVFEVNLTEKVGSNTWYRGVFNGQIIWVHSSQVSGDITKNYNLTLAEALKIQMTAGPQTDLPYAYVSKAYIKDGRVTASELNVRSGPSTANNSIGTLKENAKVTIISEPVNGWYQIEYRSSAWVNAAEKDVLYYLDPKNFISDPRQKFQFLDLAKSSNAPVNKLNENLKGKGILEGQGQAFIDASIMHGVNDIYLISHAFLETGNGTSTLAQGVVYNGVKVYNMFGVGAYDNCPIECGAKRAYELGWTTPYKAIVGGASFIGNSYIKQGQNTLYKMRWDPLAMSNNGRYGKQYATDIGWASKQVTTMYNLYTEFGITSHNLEIPVYK